VSKIAHKEREILLGLFGGLDWENSPCRRRIKARDRANFGNPKLRIVGRSARPLIHHAQKTVPAFHCGPVNAYVWSFWSAEIVEENFLAIFS
jgi:hypothetical protein